MFKCASCHKKLDDTEMECIFYEQEVCKKCFNKYEDLKERIGVKD